MLFYAFKRFRARATVFDHTVRGALSLLTSQGRWNQQLGDMYFRVHAALINHTVWGALSPPYTSRRWDRQLGAKPETDIRELR